MARPRPGRNNPSERATRTLVSEAHFTQVTDTFYTNQDVYANVKFSHYQKDVALLLKVARGVRSNAAPRRENVVLDAARSGSAGGLATPGAGAQTRSASNPPGGHFLDARRGLQSDYIDARRGTLPAGHRRVNVQRHLAR